MNISPADDGSTAEIETAYTTARQKLEAAAQKLARDMSRMLEGLAP